jgi:hypothetical protein
MCQAQPSFKLVQIENLIALTLFRRTDCGICGMGRSPVLPFSVALPILFLLLDENIWLQSYIIISFLLHQIETGIG